MNHLANYLFLKSITNPHRGVTPCRGGGAVLVDQYPQWISGRMGFVDPVQIGIKFLNNTPFKGRGEGFENIIRPPLD